MLKGTLLTSTFLLLGSISSALASCDEIDPVDLIPVSGVCPGFSLDGEVQTAYTYQELTVIINGEAGLYDQYGFVAAAFQNYTAEIAAKSVSATLSLFNQGSADSAQVLYNDPQSGSGDPIPGWQGSGEARSRVDFGYTTVHFREVCFFGKIVVISEDPAAFDGARCLGETICTLIQGAMPTESESWGDLKANYAETE